MNSDHFPRLYGYHSAANGIVWGHIITLSQERSLQPVANHGTNHRAQMLRPLTSFGVETGPQDYIYHVFAQEKHNQ